METLDVTYSQMADNLDEMIKQLNELHQERIKCKYDHADVRCAFQDRMFGILDNYYKSLTLMIYITHKKGNYKDFPVEQMKLHVKNLESIATDQDAFNSYYHLIQRTVLLDSWSCFEDSLSTVADAVLPTAVADEYKNERFEAVKKILHGVTIPADKLEKLQKTLVENHIPVVKKSNKLFSEYNGKYKRVYKDDQELLDFYRTYRNTVHSNFIYHGKDFEYEFNGELIRFVDKDAVYDNISPLNRFLVARELMLVFNELMDTINHKGLIQDTDVNKL